ncbi:MAG: YidC/Oxa1 family membrane protein insertase [Hydrogenibacillus schlegelii]|uniref:YidC/Oxa1 family membrane protein insertase n=1 Tax=Hydrogenibacillus schlegelii TaxID=1484 RepID=A0A947D3F6_HYDSH|nr:YidC/Oxa1 family membrane protein insertase [Hydrogenibacillus schlegelii]
MSRGMRRRMGVALALVPALGLAGCAPVDVPPDPRNGFFDAFFVYPISLLIDWFGALSGSYAVAILAVTVIVRVLILPLVFNQYKNMAKMQKLQPEVQKIREKYQKDPEKMQRELLKLFQAHDVSPMGGFWPLIVQMPVFIALYDAVRRSPHIKSAHFLWLELGSRDPTFVLPLVAALAQLLTVYVTQKINPMPQGAPQMRLMLVLFPLMTFFITLSLPAALPLYWTFSSLFTLVQTFLFKDLLRAGRVGSEEPSVRR